MMQRLFFSVGFLLWTICAAFAQTSTILVPIILGAPGGGCPNFKGSSLAGNLLTGPNFVTGWSAANGTSTVNYAVAPDCTKTAAFLREGVTTSAPAYSQNVTVTTVHAYKISVYAKSASLNPLRFYEMFVFASGFGSGTNVIVNLQTGVASCNPGGFGTNFTLVSCPAPTSIGNGWWYVELDFTVGATGALIVNGPGNCADITCATYTGNGLSGIYYWNVWLR